MAVIQETLILKDAFTPVFNNYITLMANADMATRQCANVANNAAQSTGALANAYNAAGAEAQAAAAQERLAAVQTSANAAARQASTAGLRNYSIAQQQTAQGALEEAAASRASAQASNTAVGGLRRVAAALQTKMTALKGVANAQKQEAQQLKASESAQKRLNSEVVQGAKTTDTLTSSVTRLTEVYRTNTAQAREQASACRQIEQAAASGRAAQRRANHEMTAGVSAAGSLTGALTRLAGAYLSLQGLKSVLTLSDNLSQTAARLDMVNEKFNTTLDLQNMIQQSAQRSRGAYQDTADMVAKLGTLAGEAFKGPEEIVAFAEQLNKQMVLSGTSAAGAQAAMLQLTQAMSSGVLRGEELNSILEQTPLIAQSIAKYMGVSTGQMRELASEGRVTAEVVKNALFAAADETNAKFAQMPYTWSQVFTSFKNTLLQAFEPVLQIVGHMAGWAAENLDIITPIFYGAAAAALAFAAATAFSKLQVAELSTALLSSPIGWIALAIGAVIAVLYKWIKAIGGVEVAWLSLKNGVLTAVEKMQIGITGFVYGAANAFDRLKVSVLQSVEKMVNGAINAINKLRSAANAVLGTSFGMISQVNMGAEAAAKSAAAANARASKLSGMKADATANQLARKVEISQAKIKAAAGSSDSVSSANAPYVPYESLATTAAIDNSTAAKGVSGIKGDTGAIKKAVEMSEEDIKSLVDVATRQYVNKINLTSQTPIITVNGANTGNTQEDRKALADMLRDIILEQAASASSRSTALVMG